MKILDISKHQKGIVLSSLTGVDGYIFRATVGSSEYDECVEDFITQAKALGKPYGFYVADYSHNTTKAIAEANKVCDLADVHGVDFPIFFDTEYFSNDYIVENYGISHTPEFVQSITTAFCERVKERGYITGVYFNKDYHNNYYTAAYFTQHPDYVKWLARPGVSAPDISCALWQYASNAGTEFGYSGNIDKNEVIDETYFPMNKATWVDCNIEYQVVLDNCESFYSADVYDIVGYLDNGQIIKAHSKSTGKIGGFYWIKMYLDGDPTEYYVAVLDEKMIKIKEIEVGFEECNIQYKVTASNCQYFYSADVYDVVDYLSIDQIITAHEKSTEQIGGFDWIKIRLDNDETIYYVVVLADRLVEYTGETEPDPEPEVPTPDPEPEIPESGGNTTPDNEGSGNVVTKIHRALPLFGGANLNFNIVGGTIAPTNPKENTIWVNTDNKISKWSLNGKEPVSPVTGQVWIQTMNNGSLAPFNALKTNVIDVHTKTIYQWNNSGWERLSGALYQNGTKSLTYSVLENVLESGVSAYTEAGYANRNGSNNCDGTSLTMNTQSVFGSGGGIHNVYTKNSFDLSSMSKLSFTVSTTAAEYNRGYTSLYVGVVKILPTYVASWCPPGWQSAGVDNSMRIINDKEWKLERITAMEGTYSLDVSDLSGEYYITFCITMGDGYGNSTNATFSNVVLE